MKCYKLIAGRLAVYSFLLLAMSFMAFLLTSALWLFEGIFDFNQDILRSILQTITYILFIIGGGGLFLDLVILRNIFIKQVDVSWRNVKDKSVAVGMTAYNDEDIITGPVKDFLAHPQVKDVIVIDNNCTDLTAERAQSAGAKVVVEPKQGFGFASMRALSAAYETGADILVLVEGDATFDRRDLNKYFSYLTNVDMVIGTRTTRELIDRDTQIDWLMNPGNQIVAKLLQIRFWGTRFTDVGCTYRVIWRDAYEKIRSKLSVGGMHFNMDMTVEALKSNLKIVEIPITFHKRGGLSKGVGTRKIRAAAVALKMMGVILKA